MLITFVSLLTYILCVCSFQWSQILIIFHVIKFCPSLNQLCVIYRESFHLDDWLNCNWDDKTKSLCDSRFQKSSISPAFTHGKEWFSWFLIGSRHHFYRKYTMTDPIENTKYLQSRAMPNDGSVCVCVWLQWPLLISRDTVYIFHMCFNYISAPLGCRHLIETKTKIVNMLSHSRST